MRDLSLDRLVVLLSNIREEVSMQKFLTSKAIKDDDRLSC